MIIPYIQLVRLLLRNNRTRTGEEYYKEKDLRTVGAEITGENRTANFFPKLFLSCYSEQHRPAELNCAKCPMQNTQQLILEQACLWPF